MHYLLLPLEEEGNKNTAYFRTSRPNCSQFPYLRNHTNLLIIKFISSEKEKTKIDIKYGITHHMNLIN